MVSGDITQEDILQKQENNAYPTDYLFFQNYPNPFNASTNIRFSIPSGMRVSLAIYDLLGRQVAVLVDDDLSAGDHVARFNAGGLGSGVYVYRLRAGEFRDAKRLVS